MHVSISEVHHQFRKMNTVKFPNLKVLIKFKILINEYIKILDMTEAKLYSITWLCDKHFNNLLVSLQQPLYNQDRKNVNKKYFFFNF